MSDEFRRRLSHQDLEFFSRFVDAAEGVRRVRCKIARQESARASPTFERGRRADEDFLRATRFVVLIRLLPVAKREMRRSQVGALGVTRAIDGSDEGLEHLISAIASQLGTELAGDGKVLRCQHVILGCLGSSPSSENLRLSPPARVLAKLTGKRMRARRIGCEPIVITLQLFLENRWQKKVSCMVTRFVRPFASRIETEIRIPCVTGQLPKVEALKDQRTIEARFRERRIETLRCIDSRQRACQIGR
ncbi:MAG TPA: hypothetical protein VFV49_11305, partial [Thermoanaerobaculia bacterium]|nr:hypothetical protein [Thermoanaerobaculia bacterium]